MDALSINKRKGPEVLNIFSGIGFLALSIFIYYNAEGSLIEKWAKIISLVSAIFFAGIILLNIFKVIKAKAAMWIDEEGFEYSSSAFSAGKIAWSNVSAISFDDQNHVIIINLKEDENYLNQFKGWKLKILERNKEKYGSPALIYSESLDLPLSEVFQMMNQVFGEFKSKGRK